MALNCASASQTITLSSNLKPEFVETQLLPTEISCSELPGVASMVKAIDPPTNGPVTITVSEYSVPDACGEGYMLYCTFTATDAEGLSNSFEHAMRVTNDGASLYTASPRKTLEKNGYKASTSAAQSRRVRARVTATSQKTPSTP
jgi:hypothetical protein